MWGPRLEGRIVRLRPIAESEIPTLTVWFADPLVLRLLGGPLVAVSPAQEKEWWETSGSDWQSVHWGLEWQGRLVGETSITQIDWMSRKGMTGTAIGYRTAWRQGIATEAMRIRAEYAFRQLDLHKLDSGYFDTNVGSGEAQRRAGYREVGRLRDELFRDGRWYDLILTELLRGDWEAAQRPETRRETGGG
ncbi:MAG: GNAT family protein [Candidatus Dormiibacterota bacterium]